MYTTQEKGRECAHKARHTWSAWTFHRIDMHGCGAGSLCVGHMQHMQEKDYVNNANDLKMSQNGQRTWSWLLGDSGTKEESYSRE